VGASKSGGKCDKSFSFQGEQQFLTGHILEVAIGLMPIPRVEKDFGDILLALVPVTANFFLNEGEIYFFGW